MTWGASLRKNALPANAAPVASTSSFVDSDRIERARFYVARMPSATSGQGGHTATFNVARKLADFGLSEAQIFDVLRGDYNPRCEPSWSDRELRHKAAQAMGRVVVNPVDDRPFEPRTPRTEPQEDMDPRWDPDSYAFDGDENEQANDDDDSDSSTPVQSGDSDRAGDGPTVNDPLCGLKHLSTVALVGRDAILARASEPVEYVWVDIAVAGTLVQIAGPPASGKTTLAFLLVAARANRGEPVTLLGRRIEPAPAGKWVVLIEGEHSEASTARKLVKSTRLLGIDDTALDRIIIVARKAVKLGSPQWRDVEHLCALGLVSDILIDTLARVAPADSNDEREQVAVFDQVAQAIEKAPDGGPKPIVWLVSHTRKNGTEGGLGLADVAGSVQRTGQADSVLIIASEKVDGRTVSSTVTFAKLREDPDEYPLPVTFSIEGDRIVLADGRADGKADDERPLEDRIAEELRKGPCTAGELKTALRRSHGDVQEAISALFDARAVKKVQKNVRGRQRAAFALRDGARPQSNPADEWDDHFEDGETQR